MPIKMIAFVLMLLIIVAFIGFNVDNKSDIRIWFGEKGIWKNVPIYYSFFVAYIVGFLSTVPFIIDWLNKTREKKKGQEESEENNDSFDEENPPRRSLFRRKSKQEKSDDWKESDY